jgi:LmbE family N-acetylglucosaminyl deacetylase
MVIVEQPWFVHLMSDLFSVYILAYVYIRRNEIVRTTQHISRVYAVIISVAVILLALNTFRIVYEIQATPETAVSNFLDAISGYGNLTGQSFIIIYLLTKKIVVEKQASPGRILVIGAHPDDIEIAAGASIAKMHDCGYQVYGLILSHGERGGVGEMRLSEAKNGAQFLELDQIHILNFSDTMMMNETTDIVGAIEKVVISFMPDLIFTHSRHDLHQDHQVVNECTLRAVRNFRTTVLCYESPSVTQEFVPVYFLDVCGYVDVKIRAIEQHWGQHKKPYMNSDLIRSKLAFRGSQAKVDYAEGFEVERMVSKI